MEAAAAAAAPRWTLDRARLGAGGLRRGTRLTRSCRQPAGGQGRQQGWPWVGWSTASQRRERRERRMGMHATCLVFSFSNKGRSALKLYSCSASISSPNRTHHRAAQPPPPRSRHTSRIECTTSESEDNFSPITSDPGGERFLTGVCLHCLCGRGKTFRYCGMAHATPS